MREEPSELEVFGQPPQGATHWQMMRLGPTARQGPALHYASPGGGVTVSEWPLSELAVETVRERWGTGRYRCLWILSKEGKRFPRGRGRTFEIRGASPVASSPANGATSDDERLQGLAAMLGGARGADDLLRLWQALEATAEKRLEAERDRMEAEASRQERWFTAQADRDRQFYTTMLQLRREKERKPDPAELGKIVEKLQGLTGGDPDHPAVQAIRALAPLGRSALRVVEAALTGRKPPKLAPEEEEDYDHEDDEDEEDEEDEEEAKGAD